MTNDKSVNEVLEMMTRMWGMVCNIDDNYIHTGASKHIICKPLTFVSIQHIPMLKWVPCDKTSGVVLLYLMCFCILDFQSNQSFRQFSFNAFKVLIDFHISKTNIWEHMRGTEYWLLFSLYLSLYCTNSCGNQA